MTSNGTDETSTVLDGQSTILTYSTETNVNERTLRWQTSSGKDFKIDSRQISNQDIITIVAPSESKPDYRLLYVEAVQTVDDAPADTSLSPYTFRSVTTKQLPERLLQDFPAKAVPAGLQHANNGSFFEISLHILISTGSGTHQAGSVWEKVLKPLLTALELVEGQHYRAYLTESDQTITKLSQAVILPLANRGVDQMVILLSGDGGMSDVVNALSSFDHSPDYRKPKIAILPMGTGNALANSSKVTNDNTLGTRTLVRGALKQLPLFQAKFSLGARLLVNEAQDERELHHEDGTPVCYGAVVVSWCFHATLVADSDSAEYRRFGTQRFQIIAKELLFPEDGSPPHTYHGELSFVPANAIEWKALDRSQHGYILATYCNQLEKGFTISPESGPLDDKLRLIHFGALPSEEGMKVMTQAYKGGKHVEDERVGYEELKTMKIVVKEADPRWRRICIDGKIISVEEGGWVEVASIDSAVVDMLLPE